MAVRKVQLADHHLSAGRTNHVLVDGQGRRPFAPFKELVVAHYPGAPGYYLMHHCVDGTATIPGTKPWRMRFFKVSGSLRSTRGMG